MSDLDWSKVPKGADKIVENPSNCNLYWAGDKGVLILGNWVLDRGGYLTIATRPAEPERKTVKGAVDWQKGEKWTHEYCGDACYVKCAEPDIDGFIVIVTREDGYMLVEPADIQPIAIKPKITKAEAFDKLNAAAPGITLDELHDKYEVV